MKRPKLFYIPGMISLLLLPVLFYMYQPAVKKQTVIKLLLPREDKQSPNSLGFTRSTIITALKGKKINIVYYNDSRALNARKLEFIAWEALKLNFYHDTTQVIKVRLSDETTYGEFVQLVNVMHKDDHKRYAWLDDDFYIFGEDPPQPEKPVIPTTACYIFLSPPNIQQATTWQDRLFEKLNSVNSFIKNNALLFSAFVLLIIVPVIHKIKTAGRSI